jgi:hypothetical protein
MSIPKEKKVCPPELETIMTIDEYGNKTCNNLKNKIRIIIYFIILYLDFNDSNSCILI